MFGARCHSVHEGSLHSNGEERLSGVATSQTEAPSVVAKNHRTVVSPKFVGAVPGYRGCGLGDRDVFFDDPGGSTNVDCWGCCDAGEGQYPLCDGGVLAEQPADQRAHLDCPSPFGTMVDRDTFFAGPSVSRQRKNHVTRRRRNVSEQFHRRICRNGGSAGPACLSAGASVFLDLATPFAGETARNFGEISEDRR